ncbi:MAG TPA: hypothetical protein VLG68_06960 [Gammaproteobacteria bacterium]|nr:hypothetical protein [Gammaproteobacteria bacterium]
MISRALVRLIAQLGATAAVFLLFGCSSGKPYALIAQVPSNAWIQAASLEVNEGKCTVHVVSLAYKDFYTPSCSVLKDQATYKSFKIGDNQVNFGAVDNGFKVLSTPFTLPPPDISAAPAAATGAAAKAAAGKPAAPAVAAVPTPTPAPAAGTATVPGQEPFPGVWLVAPYPGQVNLVGQNMGFLVTGASFKINGGDGALDVTFKGNYPALHIRAVVTSNDHGDFRLIFNPNAIAKLTSGGNFDIQLESEGGGISGNLWDSHGFDSWSPPLPSSWTTPSENSN